jgi:hypothetical protein
MRSPSDLSLILDLGFQEEQMGRGDMPDSNGIRERGDAAVF